MDSGLPRQAVWAAAAAIGVVALWGAYQGWSSTNIDDGPGGPVAGLTPGAPLSARQATALMENAGSLSEAQIRAIARQEVQAVLRPSAPEPLVPTARVDAGRAARADGPARCRADRAHTGACARAVRPAEAGRARSQRPGAAVLKR